MRSEQTLCTQVHIARIKFTSRLCMACTVQVTHGSPTSGSQDLSAATIRSASALYHRQ